MNKEEFYQEQKQNIDKRYSVLRQEKKTRPEALAIMVDEFGLSKYTLKEIMSNPSYRSTTKKLQT